MEKRCVYCRCEIVDDRCVDVCDKCGVGVWGDRMFKAIKQSMGEANVKGDLFQGSVSKMTGELELERKSFF